MIRRTILRGAAETDLASARDWYEGQRHGLGERFTAKFLERLALIAQRPELFAVMGGRVRGATIDRFPYLIFYQVEEEAVIVLAVLHASRDSDTWRLRT